MKILSVIIVFCLGTVAKCFCKWYRPYVYENADPVDVYIFCNLGGYSCSYVAIIVFSGRLPM